MITVQKGLQSATLEINGTTNVGELLERVGQIFLIDPASVKVSREGTLLDVTAGVEDGQRFSLSDAVTVKGN